MQPAGSATASPPQPKIIRFPMDNTGLRPERLPLLGRVRSQDEVTKDLLNLVETVKDPEAEISLIEGQTKLLQLRREVTRIVIANPNIADVEIFTDQPEPRQVNTGRLLNVSGRMFGTTTLSIWDETNRPVTFLVRVSLDTKDLESRIRQSFPGAEIKVRQAGPQIILEGQAPDSKTLADIVQLVSLTVTTNLSYQTMLRSSGGGGMGMGGAGAGMGMGGAGGGMGAGGAGGGMGTGGGMGGGMGGGGMGGMAGGGGGWPPRVHDRQPCHRPGTSTDSAARQDCRNQPERDPEHGGGLGLCSGQVDLRVGTRRANAPRPWISRLTRPFPRPPEQAGSSSRPSRRWVAPISPRPTANSALFGVFDAGHFSLFIEALRINSLAKILAEPNLVALEGQPARFLVGGLFPFPVPQSSSIPGGTAVVTVQFQRFGTILTFLPEILPNDVIRLDVEPVISNLNFAQSTTVEWGHRPVDRRAKRPHRRRAARRTNARDRGVAPGAHERHHHPDTRAGRSADRRTVVQRQHDRDHRDRDRRARDARACLAAR